MTTTTPLSMVARLEDTITAAFYGRDAPAVRARSHSVGLQCPVWLWTHEEGLATVSDSSAARPQDTKDVKKTCHLVEWLLHNQVDLSAVAVLAPLVMRDVLREQMSTSLQRWAAMQSTGASRASAATHSPALPAILGHHELPALNARDKTSYTYDVVIYIFGLPPVDSSTAQTAAQSDYISTALGAARKAFVMIMDSGWTAPHFAAKWPQWKHFLGKLSEEQPPISLSSMPLSTATPGAAPSAPVARLPRLVGSSLPLCCARHPGQRQLEYGVSPIVAQCAHLCLRHYDCGVAHHMCHEGCHPYRRHTACPCACSRPMPCGHQCLLPCSSRCNCFEVIERALACSHQVVLGLDPESMEPIYGTVNHIFRGVCADAELPCAVEYTTECARCLGPLRTRCFEARQAGHSTQNRTLVCDACRRLERELRSQILGEVLYGAEAEKRKLKVELQRTLHQQRKAATQGLFTPGVKVEIVDATKCVPPLLAEDDFPGISFVDMDSPNFFSRMDGAYGTLVSSHVDVMDRGEVRNLVRLPDGTHVLVTDGGLRMIRALTSGVTGKSSAALMLTFHGDAKARTVDAESAGNAPEFDAAKALVGTLCYLSQPVPCADMAAGTITDKVVTVTAIDPLSCGDVFVECRVVRRHLDTDESEGSPEGAAAVEKRPRLEPQPRTSGAEACESTTLRFSAPIAALEPLKGYQPGQYVHVLHPERQVRDPRAVADLQSALRGLAPSASPPPGRLTCAPVSADAAYELVALVNPPLWVDEESAAGEAADEASHRRTGPCVILRLRRTAGAVTMTRPLRSARGTAAVTARATVGSGEEAGLVAVPFLFTAPDELAEAEGLLDAAALAQFEQRLRDTIARHSEERAIRNDEAAFHAQQQMGSVTAAQMEEVRTEFSIPVPLPSAEQVAAVRRRHLQLPAATAVAARIAGAKDALVSKREPAGLPAWVEEMELRFRRDEEVAAAHVRSVQARAQDQRARSVAPPPAPQSLQHRHQPQRRPHGYGGPPHGSRRY